MDSTYVLLIVYGIALLSIILGFIALLTQKIYLDSNTKEPTEVEISLFGKFKTNYPALAFVILGFGFAAFAFSKTSDKLFPENHKQNDWLVTGTFENSSDSACYWRTGKIIPFPASITTFISDNGSFVITAKLDTGKTFESEIQQIDFQFPEGEAVVYPNTELQKYENNQVSLYESVTPTSRRFKPIPIKHFNQ
jgi:hypothetical protein